MSNSNVKPPALLVDRVFSDVSGWSNKGEFHPPTNKNARKAELELALTVLLVDLAGSDQNFESSEYHIIVDGLYKIFGTDALQAKKMVNQASQVLKDLRGTSRFGSLLKDNLKESQLVAIMEIVDEVIAADGIQDGFELYFRKKISDGLGIKLAEPVVAKEQD